MSAIPILMRVMRINLAIADIFYVIERDFFSVIQMLQCVVFHNAEKVRSVFRLQMKLFN